MRVIVAYDIVENRRRARLAKRLQSYIGRVQKSVFEGEIKSRDLVRLQRDIEKVIDRETDDVRIYVICASCQPRTVTLGIGLNVPRDREDLVI